MRSALVICFAALAANCLGAASSSTIIYTPDANRSVWALLEITAAGDMRIVATKDSHQPASTCLEFPYDSDKHVVISYDHPLPTRGKRGEVEFQECHVPVLDPRKMYHDHLDEATGKMAGGIHHHETTHFAVSLHPTVREFHAVDLKVGMHTKRRHAVTAETHRAYHAMQSNNAGIDSTQVQVETKQLVGPMNEALNIVLIASGYTAAQRTQFNTDVSNLISFLQLPENTMNINPLPYVRYFSVTNFFAVWYPSTDTGASHPAPAGDGTLKNNNLDCSYGASTERILTCSRAKTLTVGSHAPAPVDRALYIVLVNDPLFFGGTGGSGVCSVYNGDRINVVFIHEVGHAGFDLADEYDYGVQEPNQVALPNCYWSNVEPTWNPWILAGILPRPTPVCTYTNYFKPTPSACLMESEQPSYCPVCSEHVLGKMYAQGINLASPRYPSAYEVAQVLDGDSIVLYINRFIPYHKDVTGVFTVEWEFGGQVRARNTNAVGFAKQGTNPVLNATSLIYYSTTGPLNVTVTITDGTNIFLAAQRTRLSAGQNASSLRQVHTFRINVYTGAQPTCTVRPTPYNNEYCGTCDAGQDANCAMQYSSVPLQGATDVSGTTTTVDAWLLGVGGVFVFLGLVSFFLIWKSLQLQAENRLREVLPLTPAVKNVRIALMTTQCFMLIGTTVAIIFSAYMYGVLSVFGRTIVLGIIGIASIVWFASFLGFCAAYYKNRAVLFVNFALLLVLFGCALLFTFLLIYVLLNIDTEGVRTQLHAEWKLSVRDDAPTVCTLQATLQCSGFNTSCVTVNTPAGTSDCPANCELTNQLGVPCWLRIRAFVLKHFMNAAFAGIGLSVCVLVCLILALILGCNIKSNKLNTWKRRRERYARGETALSDEEVEMLRLEFNKIDKDGSGDISREEFSEFYNHVMGAALNARQLEEYFDKLDTDHSGTLSFQEFVKVYVPPKKPKKRTLREAQAAGGSMYTAGEDGEADGADAAEEGEAPPMSAQSQRVAPRQADIELDLVLDDEGDDIDIEEEKNRAAAAAAQEAKAREQAEAVAQAQADRQKRLALEKPSTIDVDHVLDDMAADLGGEANDFDDFDNMDLEIDLDNEEYA